MQAALSQNISTPGLFPHDIYEIFVRKMLLNALINSKTKKPFSKGSLPLLIILNRIYVKKKAKWMHEIDYGRDYDT